MCSRHTTHHIHMLIKCVGMATLETEACSRLMQVTIFGIPLRLVVKRDGFSMFLVAIGVVFVCLIDVETF